MTESEARRRLSDILRTASRNLGPRVAEKAGKQYTRVQSSSEVVPLLYSRL